MKRIVVGIHDQTVEVRCPDSVAGYVALMFGACRSVEGESGRVITIDESEGRSSFRLSSSTETPVNDLTHVDLPTFLMEAVVRELVIDLRSAVALHAGAVAHSGKSVLVAGGSGAGKSSVVAWLVDNGFSYLSDELAVLIDDRPTIQALPRALVVKPGAAEKIAEFATFRGASAIPAGSHTILAEAPGAAVVGGAQACRLIVFPRFVPNAAFAMTVLTAAEAAFKLIECNLNARNLPDGGFKAIAALARSVPAITFQYGDFDALKGRIDVFAHLALETPLDATAIRRLFSGFLPPAAQQPPSDSQKPILEKPKSRPILQATPRSGSRKRLTIGMATYDDYDGVYFSLQALRLYHPEILDDIELLVIDNHPDGPCAEPLKALETHITNYRYVPFGERSGTAVRQMIYEEAAGQSVLAMDSHVFVFKGALKRLLDYLDANPSARDLLHGPLIHDDLRKASTHFRPEWSGGMYGVWDMDERGTDPDGPPFEIPMQGLGLSVCHRQAWPGYNPHFRGFGGEEFYIHEKFRRQGGRVLCLPFLRWLHRFNRPMGLPYFNTWEDRIRNYMIGFRELRLPTQQLRRHFEELLGYDLATRIFARIAHELDELSC